MTDPTTTAASVAGVTLVTIASTIVGPIYGPFVVMAAGGFIGSLISAGATETGSLRATLLYLARYTGAAVLVTGALAKFAEPWTGLPAVELLGPAAFGVGLLGERWRSLPAMLVGWVERFLGRQPDRKD
jgi:hypothetical protein